MLEILKKLGLVVLTILAPVQAAVVTVFGLVLLDCITGILAARKQGIPITSSKLKDSVIKMLVYQAAIVLSFIIEKYLAPGIPLTNMASSYVGLVELLSLNENIEVISGQHLLAGLIDKFKQKQDKK